MCVLKIIYADPVYQNETARGHLRAKYINADVVENMKNVKENGCL